MALEARQWVLVGAFGSATTGAVLGIFFSVNEQQHDIWFVPPALGLVVALLLLAGIRLDDSRKVTPPKAANDN